MDTLYERQKKNEELLRELKITKLIIKYNRYMLRLAYKKDRTCFENFILKHGFSSEKLEKILKKKR